MKRAMVRARTPGVLAMGQRLSARGLAGRVADNARQGPARWAPRFETGAAPRPGFAPGRARTSALEGVELRVNKPGLAPSTSAAAPLVDAAGARAARSPREDRRGLAEALAPACEQERGYQPRLLGAPSPIGRRPRPAWPVRWRGACGRRRGGGRNIAHSAQWTFWPSRLTHGCGTCGCWPVQLTLGTHGSHSACECGRASHEPDRGFTWTGPTR